ncbi:hypothetical protein Trydic_g12700 [Trypoxylus dichotomus]
MTRSSLALGYTPKSSRRTKVTFIPKTGKEDRTNPKSFRSISLTSFLSKTMEEVIDNHIGIEVMGEAPLHQSQHAYRAGRSTESALLELT